MRKKHLLDTTQPGKIKKRNDLLAHELPDDGEHELLAAVDDVEAAHVDHAEAHHLAQVHGVVSVFHLFEAALGLQVHSARRRGTRIEGQRRV